ncbi:unnamed protein product [Schistosoma intercalatum]|nr:unnamed protein product [Schistosoma intercalatum]
MDEFLSTKQLMNLIFVSYYLLSLFSLLVYGHMCLGVYLDLKLTELIFSIMMLQSSFTRKNLSQFNILTKEYIPTKNKEGKTTESTMH